MRVFLLIIRILLILGVLAGIIIMSLSEKLAIRKKFGNEKIENPKARFALPLRAFRLTKNCWIMTKKFSKSIAILFFVCYMEVWKNEIQESQKSHHLQV